MWPISKASTSFLYILGKEVWTCHFFSKMNPNDPATIVAVADNNGLATIEAVVVDGSRATTEVVVVDSSVLAMIETIAIPTINQALRSGTDWLMITDHDATLAKNNGLVDVAVGGNE